jgi:hypothetical protein
MRTLRMLAIVALSCCWSLAGHAASYLPSARPLDAMASAGPAPSGVCGSLLLTQNAAQTIVPGNSVSCNADGTVHVENSYYRAFDLSAYPSGFNLCAIEVGIQSAAGAGGSQPVTFRVYANSGGAFPAGSASLLGARTIPVADQTGTMLSLPLFASVPSGSQLVLEVFTPDGQAAGNSFFIGSNSAGESAPSFLRAPNCGVVTPATNVASGFPGMHIVLNARGDSGIGQPAVALQPAVADFGQVELGFTELRAVSLFNSGTAPLTITSIATPPLPFEMVADDCSGSVLAPSNFCEIRYAFRPLQLEPVSTSLVITSNASPIAIDLRGAGLLPYPLPAPGAPALWLLAVLITLLACWRLRSP